MGVQSEHSHQLKGDVNSINFADQMHFCLDACFSFILLFFLLKLRNYMSQIRSEIGVSQVNLVYLKIRIVQAYMCGFCLQLLFYLRSCYCTES